MLLAADREATIATEILSSLGVPPDDGAVQAWTLVEGDLRGHPSHGIQRLPVIVERIRRELIRPRPNVEMRWVASSVLLVDGDRGLGPVVARRAIEELIERAGQTGVTVGAVRNSSHLGMLALYAEFMSSRGMLGIVLSTSEALVHPWGGRIALQGTNPIAIAIPLEPEPFLLDMATGVTSMGRILDHLNRGVPLPEGWALDSDGRPTTDPARASVGAITPFGGGKGYGLGLAFEVMVAVLTGTAFGKDVAGTLDVNAVGTKGDLIACIAPSVFGAKSALAKASEYLNEVRDSPRLNSEVPVSVPGDGARMRRAKALREGASVADSVWASVVDLHHSLVGKATTA